MQKTIKTTLLLLFISIGLIGILYYSQNATLFEQNNLNTKSNSLNHETSPYLKRHSDDPVFWNTWNTKCFDYAKKEDKLIIVSIGFSSCHWCHVMEKETFEDLEVADFMNKEFVSIKVDREERPDIDHLYMSATQIMTGKGGWPLNVILLPNGKPIYGGTYHTKKQWISVLKKVLETYSKEPKKLMAYAENVAAGIKSNNVIEIRTDSSQMKAFGIGKQINHWKKSWDTIYGGELTTEKFLKPSSLEFLMNYGCLTKDTSVLNQLELTLDKIYAGGIFDHVSGGFFRYSTDSKWQIPHFEKMLYNNAQMLSVYSKAYRLFKKEEYKYVIDKTISFLKNEMFAPSGGYISSIDADNEGKEGVYYTWTKDELLNILGKDSTTFKKYYQYIPLPSSNQRKLVINKKFHTSSSITTDLRNSFSEKLSIERKKRKYPKTDTKKITSWNAMLITGFLDAFKATNNENYLFLAKELNTQIISKETKNKTLKHLFDNNKSVDAFLEDYAFLIAANLELFSVTGDRKHLTFATEITNTALKKFSDSNSNMLSFSESSELLSKIVKINDGVFPSPNAIMAENLLKLSIIYKDKKFEKKSKTMISAITPYLKEDFKNYLKWGTLLLSELYPFREVIITGPEAILKSQKILSNYFPNTQVYVCSEEPKDILPLFKDKFVNHNTLIYICEKGSCKLPTSSTEKALEFLKEQ